MESDLSKLTDAANRDGIYLNYERAAKFLGGLSQH